ncbi:hypothetical protein G6541_11075 [Streptomyces albidoflavus]|nr:hypothetical protein [Streptomyces albidoflavus]
MIVSGAAATPRLDVETVLLCDVLPDGAVAGVALVEPVYDTNTGVRVATRVVDPSTGDPYTPAGELRACDSDGCNATTTALVLCDTAPDGTVVHFVRATTYDCQGEQLATLDRALDGTPYTATGTVGVCPASADCESPTTPVTSVGLCLADGTPIAVTVTRDCAGAVTSEGWLNLTTGAWAAGTVPAGTVACGDSRSIQVSGTFCDVDDTTGDVLGLVLVEYTYDEDGAIAAVRLVDAVTGDTYTPTGTVTVCPAGVEQPERDLLQLCDTAGDGTVTPFVRDYSRDENGAIAGHADYALDGTLYTPAGTVGVCSGTEACRDSSTVLVCDVPDDSSTVITPTMVDGVTADTGQTQFQNHPGPYAPLWAGDPFVYPAGAGPAQEHLTATGQVTADLDGCDGAAGTLTISVRVRNDGPDDGQAWDGALRLFRGTTLVAAHNALEWAPPGWQGTLTVSAPVTAAEVAAGDIRVALTLETYHLGAKSWTADQFTAALELEGCEATSSTQFLRTLVTDCETGEVVSTTDTTLDGGPYTVTGTVGQCTPAATTDECRDCETTVLCDVTEEGTTPFARTVCRDCTGAVVSVLDTALDGTTPFGVTGTVGSCGPDDCPTTSVQVLRLCDLDPSVEADEDGRRCAVPFLRHLAYDCSGNLLGFHDTGLDGTTPYEPVQVVDCQCATGQGTTSSIEVPWVTVSVVEDPAGTPQQDFIYTVSPEDDPSRIGTVHVHVSRAAGGACGPYDINALIFSNSSTYTLTLDAIAQEMSYLRVDLADFDTFEPVGIASGTPEPTRLGGTAGWNPGHTRIVPAENNGTGYMYWDAPPETISWTVFNTGGGVSCSLLSFQGMTVDPGGCCGDGGDTSSCDECDTVVLCDVPAGGGDPVSFLRHVCRDCEGAVTSTTDTELDGTTVYTPMGTVTSCGAVKDCPTTYGTECWELVTAQAAYDNTNTVGGPCGTITPNMTQCAGTFRLNSWIVDGVERVVGAPPEFTAVGCGGNPNQLHGAWAAALAALDPGTDWQPAYNGVCLWYVRTNAANPATAYGTMILERIAGGTPAVYTLGSAQSSSREVYTKTFVEECDGTTTVQWLDADGNEIPEPVGDLTSCGASTTSSVAPTTPDEATPVGTAIRRLTGAGTFDAAGLGVLQSATVVVLAGSATVATSDGTAEVPAGASLSWSVATDQDSAVAVLTVTTDAADDVLVTATFK